MKLPLIIFSPLPPVRNGIADYTQLLLEALQEYYMCVCVVSDDAPIPNIKGERLSWITQSSYVFHREKYISMRHLFQVGNNTGHAYMLPWLERLNGVTTIHDASLTNLLATIAPEGRRSATFTAALGGEILPEIERVTDAVEALAGSGLYLGDEANGLDLIAYASRAVVVHSLTAAIRVLAAAPDAKVEVIPHLVTRGVSCRKHDVRDGPFRVLCLGYIARAKRIDIVLRAIKVLRDNGCDVELTIAGAPDPRSYDIEADISALGASKYVRLNGYISETEIDEFLLESDVLINLRNPTTGETSGVLSRAMALGCACIVTDVGWYAELPQDCVLKVPLACMAPEDLAQSIYDLITDPLRRQDLGRRAWELSAENEPHKVALRYAEVIERSYRNASRVSPLALEGSGLRFSRPPTIHQTDMPTWHFAGLLPLAHPGSRVCLVGGGDKDLTAAQTLGWNLPALEEPNTDVYDAYLILNPPSYDADVDIQTWMSATVQRLARGGIVIVVGPISNTQFHVLMAYFLPKGLQLVKKINVADLPALSSLPILPAEWKGLVFAPQTLGLGSYTT
jgi:glycosyltransferase involved in cell wall biosynthesis